MTKTKYFIPKSVEVSKLEYDAYLQNEKSFRSFRPMTWLESLINQVMMYL